MKMVGESGFMGFHDECGVFGIWGDPEASRLTYLGLYALQHRGQESAGIVSSSNEKHHHHKGLGLVADVFSEPDLDRLKGRAAIGHVRYSTTGGNLLTNAQPLTARLKSGPAALAHNGNVVNGSQLREKLVQHGAIFQGTNDTECLLHLLSRTLHSDFVLALKESLQQIEGAMSLVMLNGDQMIAARDPLGFRPLVLGRLGNAYVISSETCAFDLIGAKYIREIEPGEIFWVDQTGEHSTFYKEKGSPVAKCIFEYIYFARPDSILFGQGTHQVRKKFGAVLSRENPVNADLVVPVPDSGVAAALGYSEESGISFELGIIRNHYVGRTFIEPKASIRSFGVKIKLNPLTHILKNKRIIIVDDSIVRGTTSRKIIQLVRQAGAKEVHFRVSSPATIGPCYYGVDTPERDQLIASQKTVEEVREYIGADSLAYLSHGGMLEAVQSKGQEYCQACFDNQYPTKIHKSPSLPVEKPNLIFQ
jgi:amidophosphoribosyltransferase